MAVGNNAVWRVRPSGNNANGGGFDATISGAGTDYSQQNTAQLTLTDIACSNTTTVTSATGGFTTAMIGNAIWLTGGGATASAYFITARASTNSITIDRAPGTITAGSGRVGGGWANLSTNCQGGGPLAPGNTVYILGGATPSYASPDYTSSYFTPMSGDNTTGGTIWFAGDPATPSSNGFGGLPVLCTTDGTLFYNGFCCAYKNFWAFATNANASGLIATGSSVSAIIGVVFDQNGYDIGLTGDEGYSCNIFNCEVFSSAAQRTTNTKYGISVWGFYGSMVMQCNVHDCIGGGIKVNNIGSVANCIAAKNNGTGIYVVQNDQTYGMHVTGNTVDGNTGHGIEFQSSVAFNTTSVVGNLITNHTGVGKAGLAVGTQTTAQNDRLNRLCDYQTFWNNTANHSAISSATHDIVLGSDPYVASSTQNYTLK